MKLDAVSDTHDSLDYVETAVSHFESEGVDVVVHCGNIVVPLSVAPFDADLGLHAVRGNNDGEWVLRGVVESFGTYHGDFAYLTLDGQEIAVYHGMEARPVDVLVNSGACDFVLCDHSREWVVERRGATTHINSGGLPTPGADDVFHAAVVDLDMGDVTSRPL